MKTHKEYLTEKFRDREFAGEFHFEKQKLRIAYDIHTARLQYGLTQAKLAERANITQQMVSRVENATTPNISLKTLSLIGKALGLDVGFVHPAAPFEPTAAKKGFAEKKISARS